jgi:hypothetical protein
MFLALIKTFVRTAGYHQNNRTFIERIIFNHGIPPGNRYFSSPLLGKQGRPASCTFYPNIVAGHCRRKMEGTVLSGNSTCVCK